MTAIPLLLPAETTTGAEMEPVPRRPSDALRWLLHVAAALPLVIFGIADMARGWRPLFDNAAIALRSYHVLSHNSPLLGHRVDLNMGSQSVYGLGPLENWLLAVPVHLDPGQGAMWGAVLFAVIGVVLAVEAAWSAARWWGAAIATTSILVLFAVRGDVIVDVVWNPWFGVIWLYSTLASGWAVATGRLRWWPVAVVSASIAAQCHEVFTLPAIAVGLAAAVLGVIVCRSREDRVGFGWLVAGAGAGVVSWIAPVVQQLTSHPGNFTVLWRVVHQPQAKIGISRALGALGGATRIVPKWVHAPPLHGAFANLVYIANLFIGDQWWAVTALVLLAVITIVAFVTRRHLLAASAALSLVAALGTVMAIATIPIAQFLTFGYSDVLLIPVGTAVWITLAWTLVELARSVLGRSGARGLPRLATRTHAAATRLAALAGATMVTVVCAWSIASGGALVGTNASTISGWSAVRATDVGVAAVERVAPPRTPFRLQLAEPGNNYRFAVVTGIAYLLNTDGLQPRLIGVAAATFGEARPDMPVVHLHVPATGDKVTASVGRPHRSAPSRHH
jgi:hypothetical protein